MRKIWKFFLKKLIEHHLWIWSNRFLFSASFLTSDLVWTFSPLHSSPFILACFWIHIPSIFFPFQCSCSLTCLFALHYDIPLFSYSALLLLLIFCCFLSSVPSSTASLPLFAVSPSSSCLYPSCLPSHLSISFDFWVENWKWYIPPRSIFVPSLHSVFPPSIFFFPLQFSPSTLIFCVIWKVICSSL